MSQETPLINLPGDVSEVCKSALFEMSLRQCTRHLKAVCRWKHCDCMFCMIYLILSCLEQIGLKSHSLFYRYTKWKCANSNWHNTCVKCQVDLEDKKLYTIKDDITNLIDYGERIENNHLTPFLNGNRDTGLIKIHRDCQKDAYNALKRKSTEPICTTWEWKPARWISTGNVTVSIVEKNVKSIPIIQTE